MGLLDELKQQADALRLKQQASQEERNQSVLRVHAQLKDTLHYWVELFNSLNVLKPTIARSYYVDSGATGFDNLMPRAAEEAPAAAGTATAHAGAAAGNFGGGLQSMLKR